MEYIVIDSVFEAGRGNEISIEGFAVGVFLTNGRLFSVNITRKTIAVIVCKQNGFMENSGDIVVIALILGCGEEEKGRGETGFISHGCSRNRRKDCNRIKRNAR
ncbi:hypothetical protein HHI36_013223 [Cryptolaemus montrouzieri]|uniref:Uncharacterized protein n=1 Tax=Cryptolaemus montrouzieri TaxID=559131 RepID=A0ABD2NGN6_9CUCU